MSELDPAAYVMAFRETRNPAILADSSFTIQDVNEACLDVTGYGREELLGQTPSTLINDPETVDEIRDTLANDDPWAGTLEVVTKHNHMVYGHGTATPIVQDGNLVAYACFWVDLSDQRRYENTLRILNRVLRHNLRNDANVILGYIDAVQTELDTPELRGYLDNAEAKLQEIVSQAETARDLDTLITEKAKTTNKPVRVDTMLAQTVDRFRSEFPESTITVTNTAEHDVVALADEALQKVFDALVENAIEHNESATPVVEIELEAAEHTVTVSVGDNGPGIPESQHDQVFGREEKDQVHHGQGLSLFFVDQMIEKYKGDIWIEPNEPTGTVFVVELRTPERDPPSTTAQNTP